MIERKSEEISIKKQCELLSIQRSGLYYEPKGENLQNLILMELIDKQYQKTPFYGVPRMNVYLNSLGYLINEKRVSRLYKKMALRAIYPGQNTSKHNKEDKKYPYLLRELKITRRNQVWACDITYLPMFSGFMYLVAIIDIYSRFVVGWGISNSLDKSFCMEVLEKALLEHGKPEIFNTDQGSQFTSKDFTGILLKNEIQISMDGKGRAIDNIFIERLWRSIKYEDIYLHAYADGIALYKGIKDYFLFYNNDRFHQSLDYQRPCQLYNIAA